MCGALDPSGAICGPYGAGVGTEVCVAPWLLQPGEEKKLEEYVLADPFFATPNDFRANIAWPC